MFIAVAAFPKSNKQQRISHIDSLITLSEKASFDVDLENTIIHAINALAQSQSIKYARGEISASNLIGQAMFNSGNYKEALRYFSVAENVKSKENFSLSLSQIYKTKAQIYFELGMSERAVGIINTALEKASDIKNESNRNFVTSQIYEVMANIYNDMGCIDSVNIYNDKNLALLTHMDDKFAYPLKINLYSLIASISHQHNDYDTANSYLSDAIKLIDQFDYTYLSNTYKIMGDTKLALHQPDSALQYLVRAEKNIAETGLTSELPELYQSFSAVYEYMGLTDSSRIYLDKKISLERDFIKENLKASNIAFEILLKQEALVRAKASKSRNTMVLLAILSVVVLLVLSYFLFRNIKKHPKINKTNTVSDHIDYNQLDSHQSDDDYLLDLAEEDISEFTAAFKTIYPKFHQSLMSAHPDLTVSDLSLCYMAFLDIPTRDIAKYSSIEVRSVQTKRSRVRKKMNLPTEVDFKEYLHSFNSGDSDV